MILKFQDNTTSMEERLTVLLRSMLKKLTTCLFQLSTVITRKVLILKVVVRILTNVVMLGVCMRNSSMPVTLTALTCSQRKSFVISDVLQPIHQDLIWTSDTVRMPMEIELHVVWITADTSLV